ncbi:MAG: hypothetical protein NT013_01275 [Planctomycetia bacterium]|nr:hypothetical protein [Planctomycetia bacterium]
MNRRCNCGERTLDESCLLLLPHFPDCELFSESLRALLTNLVRGIEAWAAADAGVHPECWEAYEQAKMALGEPAFVAVSEQSNHLV